MRENQVKEVLEMLVNDKTDLKLDIIRETIEELQSALAAATAERVSLSMEFSQSVEKLAASSANAAQLVIERDALLTRAQVAESFVESGKQELLNQKTVLDGFQTAVIGVRAKIVDEILGKMEVCGDSQEIRDAAKLRIEKMELEELDAEAVVVMKTFREKFKVSPIGVPLELSFQKSMFDGVPVVQA